MQRIFSVIFIILLFAIFSISDISRKSAVKILQVITASEVVADLNNNNIADSNEYICIPNIEVLSANLSKENKSLQNRLKLTDTDSIKLGYLSDNFADITLTDKYVKLTNRKEKDYKCIYSDILINGESYRNKLLVSGYGFEKDSTPANFNSILDKARKLNLVILNHKSNKYHKLDCEYGQIANDAIILPQRQIPKDAKPCKYCHITHNTKSDKFPHSAKKYPDIVSAGDVKLYLTDLTTQLKPNRNCTSSVCKEVLNQINSAKSSIDIALYGFDNIPEITKAITNAKARSVKINIVYDNSTKSYYPETQNLLKIADKTSGDSKETLMHNKFIIIDDSKVITGSMNFSSTGFSGFNTNSLVIINSKEIANIYKSEFNQMLNGKFSISKSKHKIKTVKVGTINITPLFSPQDKAITNHVVPLINNAKSYIYIPAFVITHKDLAQALINAKNRGVEVKIIIDATGLYSTGSKTKLLRDKGIDVKVENYAGKVHSKSIIIDDRYIITGSMNLSKSGENKNDENMLIIEDERLAKYYKEFFKYIWLKIPDKYLKRNIRAESKASIGSCYDGIDNNFDGKIDMQDDGCR